MFMAAVHFGPLRLQVSKEWPFASQWSFMTDKFLSAQMLKTIPNKT